MSNPIIELFEKAVRDHEMIGTFDVQDRPLIEAKYKDVKSKLEKLIDNLVNSKPLPPMVIPKSALTPELLADAFDCFNNEAITQMHNGTHDVACIAAGFNAVAARLRGN